MLVVTRGRVSCAKPCGNRKLRDAPMRPIRHRTHLPPHMDAELQKLVEAGKLTTKSAEQLEELKPGTFCLHKSWGFGRVREWNLLLNQIVIGFATKKSHPMQAQ